MKQFVLQVRERPLNNKRSTVILFSIRIEDSKEKYAPTYNQVNDNAMALAGLESSESLVRHLLCTPSLPAAIDCELLYNIYS